MAFVYPGMQPRRPLAPLAISRPDGTTSAVPAPTQSRSPTGTIFPSIQQMRSLSPVQNRFTTMFSKLRQQAPTAARPAAAPAAPVPVTPFAPNIVPPAQTPGQPAGGGAAPQPNIAPMAPPPSPAQPAAPQPPPAQPASGSQAYGATISNLTGQERPQAITPGGSVTDPLQERAQAEAMRALENPSPYDDQLFQQEVQRARGAFDADIASRGLDYSSIAPQEFSRQVLNPLLSQRAQGIAEARRSALAGAQGVIGQRTGLEAGGREELRGERGYVDQLREQARQNEIQRYQLGESQFQNTLKQALDSGDPTQALNALYQSAYGMGGPAAAYGAQAAQSGAGLQDLAQQFIEQFYGNRGAPAQ